MNFETRTRLETAACPNDLLFGSYLRLSKQHFLGQQNVPFGQKESSQCKSVISSPLELIWVVSPSGISLHFLDFRSSAEIRRPPAQIRRHPAWISCGPLYNAIDIEGPSGGPRMCSWDSKIGILVHPILAKYKQGGQ